MRTVDQHYLFYRNLKDYFDIERMDSFTRTIFVEDGIIETLERTNSPINAWRTAHEAWNTPIEDAHEGTRIKRTG